MGVVEEGLPFGACWGRAVLFAAPVNMDSPRQLQYVAACPIGCRGVSVNVVVCTVLSGFLEDDDVYCVFGTVIVVFFEPS